MIPKSWHTTTKSEKEMDDKKKELLKKDTLNWDTPEGMDK